MAIEEKSAKATEEDTPTSNDALLNNNDGKGKKKGMTITKKGNVLVVVTMLDGHDIKLEVSKTALGKDLFRMVCSNLQLLEKDWFSLVYRVNNVKYWLNHERKISKQLKNAAWDFSFQVKFYPSEPTIMHEDLTRYQLFLQVRTDIYTGKLPCSFVTYSLLGSYAAQSEFGDYDPQELGHGIQYLKDAAPYAPNQSDDLLERICELHTSHARMNPADAEMAYLENAKVLALYGVDLHFAKDEDFSDVMVGVCSYGLNVYREKLRMHRFPWAKIIKFGYKRSMFYIKIRSSGSKKDPANLTYKLANHSMAKRLWKSAVEHHAFFRLKVAEPPVKGMFPLFTSRFRYSGRTQHETCNEYHDIDRKTPTIDRAASRRYAGGLNKPYDNPTGTGTAYSTDRVEETIMPSEQHTATLDIRTVRKNRSLNTPTEELNSSLNVGERAMRLGEDGDFSNVSYSKGGNIGYDQYGNPISNAFNGSYGGDNSLSNQDDHLKNTSQLGGGHSTITTNIRTFTDSDGSKMTKKEVVTTYEGGDDFDHDKALHDAIFAVTDMNQDLAVQKIEIQAEK